MLVLARKVGESILIGDHIEIHVQEVRGKRVALSISAPYDIRILRAELCNGSAAAEAESVPTTQEAVQETTTEEPTHEAA